jgi:ATP phosphoribosyltransferase
LIANKNAVNDNWKKEKIENLMMLLQGALQAEGLVGLKLNIEKSKIAEVSQVLTALKKPTISPLQDENWVALEVIIEEVKLKKILPQLKKIGAEGIIEYPLNKVIY